MNQRPNQPSTEPVEFYFDPVCPWTWNTYRWLREVAAARQLTVRLRPLSLKVLNAGREIPKQYLEAVEAGHASLRIVAALEAAGRSHEIAAFYDALGERFFHELQPATVDTVISVAEAIGLGEYAAAAKDPSYDEAVQQATQRAIDLAGPDVGSPVLVPGEQARAYHGPVVSPVPTGKAALELWDAIATLSRLPGVYEVKRGRSGEPDLSLVTA